MDALRVIPQVFFDLIARVIPGAAAMFVAALAIPGGWAKLMSQIELGPKVIQESGTLWILTLFVGSYTVGHILSPVSKVLQNILPAKKVIEPFYCGVYDSAPQAQFVRAELGHVYDAQHEQSIWIWYDWLRVFVPGAGELVARIRAEYTMYSSLSVAFAAGAMMRIPYTTPTIDDGAFLAAMAGLATLMALRYQETEHTFRRSVTNLYFVSRGAFDSRWKVPAKSDSG